MSGELVLGEELPADLLAGGRSGPAVSSGRGETGRFYVRTVRDEEATIKAGVPKHKGVLYVEITIPGDKSNAPNRPSREEDKRRFPAAWQAFLESGERDKVVGTALDKWAGISEPRAEDLKALKIRTVEELAAVTDGHLSALGPDARRLRDAAKAYLEAAKGLAPVTQLQEELRKRDEQIADLQRRLSLLDTHQPPRSDVADDDTAFTPTDPPTGAPKRKGRPPKLKAE